MAPGSVSDTYTTSSVIVWQDSLDKLLFDRIAKIRHQQLLLLLLLLL